MLDQLTPADRQEVVAAGLHQTGSLGVVPRRQAGKAAHVGAAHGPPADGQVVLDAVRQRLVDVAFPHERLAGSHQEGSLHDEAQAAVLRARAAVGLYEVVPARKGGIHCVSAVVDGVDVRSMHCRC